MNLLLLFFFIFSHVFCLVARCDYCEMKFENCSNVPGLQEALESNECIKMLSDDLEYRGESLAEDCACNMKLAVKEELLRTRFEFKQVDSELDGAITEVRVYRRLIHKSWLKLQQDQAKLDGALRREGKLFALSSKLRWKLNKLEDFRDYYNGKCRQ